MKLTRCLLIFLTAICLLCMLVHGFTISKTNALSNRNLQPSSTRGSIIIQPLRINANTPWRISAREINDDDEDERIFATSSRRQNRDRNKYDEESYSQNEYREQPSQSTSRQDRTDYLGDDIEDEYYSDDEYDYESDDDEAEEEYGLLSNVVIPNPLLDSIDPEGSADRFPELARDPRFWFDMLLFVAFLDFLSAVGPRDPFPDIPMF